ncbi:DUF4333 domain-containing protein [Leekyejoonella antrihumi]|nr:DUF4333 domain-containing protein [Leekyejoonella antrihumi]
MNHPARRAATCLTAAAVLALGVSGCSSSVQKNDIEKAIKSKLGSTLSGHKIGAVKCAGDLKAKKGASTSCTTTIDGTKRTFSAVVTKVDGSKVLYTIKASVG